MKYVPINKRSKKAQKEFNSKSRLMWVIPPVTKIIPNKKKDFKEEICLN